MRDSDDDIFDEHRLGAAQLGLEGERRTTAFRAAAELTYLAGMRAASDQIPLELARRQLLNENTLRREFYGPDDERSEVAFRLWDDLSHLAALRAAQRPITAEERQSARRVINFVRELMNERRRELGCTALERDHRSAGTAPSEAKPREGLGQVRTGRAERVMWGGYHAR
jgi:hypothetical protein